MQIHAISGVPYPLSTERETSFPPQSLPGVGSPGKSWAAVSMPLPHPRPGRRSPHWEASSPHSPPLFAGRCAGMAGHTLRNGVPSSQCPQCRTLNPHSPLAGPSLPAKRPAREKRALLLRGKTPSSRDASCSPPRPPSPRGARFGGVWFSSESTSATVIVTWGPRAWGGWILLQKSAFSSVMLGEFA